LFDSPKTYHYLYSLRTRMTIVLNHVLPNTGQEVVNSAMTEKSLITEEMRAAIGKPLNFGEPFGVGKGAIRNMAEAMNYLNPLYLDEAYAKSKGHTSVLAPPRSRHTNCG
jgi:hypothetical protein